MTEQVAVVGPFIADFLKYGEQEAEDTPQAAHFQSSSA